jgi:hypothetical protein
MGEYISRGDLLNVINTNVAEAHNERCCQLLEAILKAPTADVVEVVRCKDCKFWGIPHANDVEKSHYCCRDNMWCMPLRFADDFCSYGERKENGT